MSQEPSLSDQVELSGPGLMAGTAAHGEALVGAATRALASGRPRDAFALADRRCRLTSPPAASALALRALALWFLDARAEATADLARAFAADPADPLTALAALQLSNAGADLPDPALLVAQTATAHDLLRLALRRFFAGGSPAFARLDPLDGRLLGWVAWTGESDRLDLVLSDADGTERHALVAEPGFPLAPPGARGAYIDRPVSATVHGFKLARAGEAEPLAQGVLWPRSTAALSNAASRAPEATPDRRAVVVLVPVYEDFEATQDCLRAAVAAKAEADGAPVRVLVVDDASPNRRLRLLLDALAGRGLVELLRNESNLGFAGAVNRGLESLREDEDVLILNSDAVLPPGALARLADVAYAEAGIGTVTPFSNAGELASFPARVDRAPLPTVDEARRIDAAAARAHGSAAIDLPTGTGFALFLRHDARHAVRRVTSLFGRGYFEDLDLCLRLRAAGFRNVAAPGIFVPHGGGRSFSAERTALLAKNRRLADRRFPTHRTEASAFAAADPLRAARGRIEAALPASSGAPLLVFEAGDPLAEERQFRLRGEGETGLALEWRRSDGATHLRLRASERASAPQSLAFVAEESDAGFAALSDLAPPSIECVGAPPPAALWARLAELGAPLEALVEGAAAVEAWIEGDDPKVGLLRRILAADRGTEALLRQRAASCPVERLANAPSAFPPRVAPSPPLGLLLPRPGPRAERFLRAVSARLRARAPGHRIMVLGATMDDAAAFGLGNVFVTGRVAPGELGPLVRHLQLGALCLPPGTPGLGQLDRLVAETGLPMAAIDPAGRPDAPSPHLHLDSFARDRDNALALVDWLLGGVASPPT